MIIWMRWADHLPLRSRRYGSRPRFRQYIPPRHYCMWLFFVFVILPLFYIFYLYNIPSYVVSLPFYFFQYPLEVDMVQVVDDVRAGKTPSVEPLNKHHNIIKEDKYTCRNAEGEEENIFLLFVIKSKYNNFDSRDGIRRTWGNSETGVGVPVKHIFLLGLPSDHITQGRIDEEHRQYGDIVQGQFVDKYYNNSLKMVMGFQWATTNCRNAQYFAFIDDDFFVSPYNLVSYLQTITPEEQDNFIAGYTKYYGFPDRWRTSAHYISLEEYPYLFYPPFPTAGSFFVSQATAQKLIIAMRYVKMIRFDDIFLAISAWKLNIPVRHLPGIHFHEYDVPYLFQQHSDVISAHGFKDTRLLFELWNEHFNEMQSEGRIR